MLSSGAVLYFCQSGTVVEEEKEEEEEKERRGGEGWRKGSKRRLGEDVRANQQRK